MYMCGIDFILFIIILIVGFISSSCTDTAKQQLVITGYSHSSSRGTLHILDIIIKMIIKLCTHKILFCMSVSLHTVVPVFVQ